MKNYKTLLICLGLLLVSSLLLFGCGAKESNVSQPNNNQSGNTVGTESGSTEEKQSTAEPVKLTYAGGMPPTHHITELMNIFSERVEEHTSGQVSFELYPAGQLYGHDNAPEAVATGAIDVAQLDSSMMGGLSEAAGMTALDFLVTDDDTILELHEKFFDLVDQELQANGVKLLFWMPYGSNNGPMTKDKQITKLEDLQGVKLRSLGEISARWLEEAGASPIHVASSEVYHALSNGLVDGAMSGIGTYYSRKWYEVSNYMIGDRFSYSMFLTTMNLDKWNSLSADVQQAMLDIGHDVFLLGSEMVKETEAEALATIEKEVEVYWLPDEEKQRWRELLTPVYEEWAQRTPATKEIMEYIQNK